MRTGVRFLAAWALSAVLSISVPLLAAPAGAAPSLPVLRTQPVQTWIPIGPAPTLPGSTTYLENASGRITGVAAHPLDPQTLFVATAGGGVWRTRDGGTTWTALTDDQATLFTGAVAIAPSSPNVVYAGTGEANMGPSKRERHNIYYGRGILRSGNGGDTWTLTGADAFDRRTISRLVVDPQDPNTVYAAVGAQSVNGLAGETGILKTTDGGLNWTNTTRALTSTAAYSDLVMDPFDRLVLFAAIGQPDGADGDGINRNGVYATSDGGLTWSSIYYPATSLTGRVALAVSRAYPSVLYAASARTSDQHLEKVVRADATGWTQLTTPGSLCPSGTGSVNVLGKAGDYHLVLAVDPDPARAQSLYLGGICTIRSRDGGVSWDPIPVAPGDTSGPHRDHHALEFDAWGRLLDGNDGGIWRLDGYDPVLWSNLNGNLQTVQMIGLSLHPTNLSIAFGGTQDTGTVRFEGNLEWTRRLRGDGGASAAVLLPNGQARVYQVTRISSTGAVFRRSNTTGDTFVSAADGIDPADSTNFYPPIALDPRDRDHVYLATDRVYETVTAGTWWYPMPRVGWTVADPVDSLALSPSTPGTIYAGAGPHFLASFDGGQTWSQRDPAGVTGRIKALAVDAASNLTVFAVSDGFGGPHVLRSLDGGLSWTDIGLALPNLPVQSLVLDPRSVPAAVHVGTDGGVWSSSDVGATWSRLGAGLPNAQVADLQLNVSTGVLAAATHGRGVWILT
jgi:photosystem II stability/assembly factor-like uncharacterized protein